MTSREMMKSLKEHLRDVVYLANQLEHRGQPLTLYLGRMGKYGPRFGTVTFHRSRPDEFNTGT